MRTLICAAMEDELKAAFTEIVRKIGAYQGDQRTGIKQTTTGEVFHFLKLGIGRTHANFNLGLYLGKNGRPDSVVLTGTCAALTSVLKTGDVIIPNEYITIDYGHIGPSTMTRTIPGSLPGDEENPWVKASHFAEEKAAKLELWGRPPFRTKHATGDHFLEADRHGAALRQELDAHSFDMEGAPLALVCREQNIPFLMIKAVSDHASAGSSSSFERNRELAAFKAATIVSLVLLGNG